jgi:hypothetical protein
MIRPSVLWLATLMVSPALYRAFVTGHLPVQSAMTRFLLAVPAAALMLAALRYVTSGYGSRSRRALPLRRRADQPPDGA